MRRTTTTTTIECYESDCHWSALTTIQAQRDVTSTETIDDPIPTSRWMEENARWRNGVSWGTPPSHTLIPMTTDSRASQSRTRAEGASIDPIDRGSRCSRSIPASLHYLRSWTSVEKSIDCVEESSDGDMQLEEGGIGSRRLRTIPIR